MKASVIPVKTKNFERNRTPPLTENKNSVNIEYFDITEAFCRTFTPKTKTFPLAVAAFKPLQGLGIGGTYLRVRLLKS
jgi:hypothetical protein